jgi:hypothetical protein
LVLLQEFGCPMLLANSWHWTHVAGISPAQRGENLLRIDVFYAGAFDATTQMLAARDTFLCNFDECICLCGQLQRPPDAMRLLLSCNQRSNQG